MRRRLFCHLVAAIFIIYLFLRKIVTLTDFSLIIISIPYIVMNLLDIYYLAKATIKVPRALDSRLSSMIISLLVTCHGAFVIIFCQPADHLISGLLELGAVMQLLMIVFIVWALLSLKSNLTVLPEANSLVQKGPYKFIRHPLYFAYIVMAINEVLIFQSFLILAFAVIQIALILIRARREEELLGEAFPEYRDYSKNAAWFLSSLS